MDSILSGRKGIDNITPKWMPLDTHFPQNFLLTSLLDQTGGRLGAQILSSGVAGKDKRLLLASTIEKPILPVSIIVVFAYSLSGKNMAKKPLARGSAEGGGGKQCMAGRLNRRIWTRPIGGHLPLEDRQVMIRWFETVGLPDIGSRRHRGLSTFLRIL